MTYFHRAGGGPWPARPPDQLLYSYVYFSPHVHMRHFLNQRAFVSHLSCSNLTLTLNGIYQYPEMTLVFQNKLQGNRAFRDGSRGHRSSRGANPKMSEKICRGVRPSLLDYDNVYESQNTKIMTLLFI